MAAFDYKTADKQLYAPSTAPALVTVPPLPLVAVEGEGDPNDPAGAFAQAVAALYAVSYTLRMSPQNGRDIPGYFPYVVPPLEGWWWQEGGALETALRDKSRFCWQVAIRLPDFATPAAFAWAQETAAKKKGVDTARTRRIVLTEGLCVQCLHRGSYDDEPATLARMADFLAANGCQSDLGPQRRHHEIYLSDPRRTAVEKRRTILRLPVKRQGA